MDICEIKTRLLSLYDEEYRAFTLRLTPTLDPAHVIGVRMKEINRIAAQLHREGDAEAFMAHLPHEYHEENMLHSALIHRSRKPAAEHMTLIDAFLPHVSNWAVCDILPPKAFKEYTAEVRPWVERGLSASAPFTQRFALVVLINFFLEDETFDAELMRQAALIESDEYYVNMALAWYVSEALVKQYESALPLIEGNALTKRVHNKTIQKAVESYRMSEERKAYLKSLRRSAT